MKIHCPHCDVSINVADKYAGHVARCRKCQEEFRVPLLDLFTPREEGGNTTARVFWRWTLLVVGATAICIIIGTGLAWLNIAGGVFSDPYKNAAREYLNDNYFGKVIELQWGNRRRFVVIRGTKESYCKSWQSPHQTDHYDIYYDPDSGGGSTELFSANLDDSYFTLNATAAEQKKLREASTRGGYKIDYCLPQPHVTKCTYRKTKPSIALALKYRMETPAFGQGSSHVKVFFFEPGSSKIFDVQRRWN